MRQLIAGNWKMNGLRSKARTLVETIRAGSDGLACDLLVCPPATVLSDISAVLAGSTIAIGGQDCHAANEGAHTGDISASMLLDAGAAYVILGHSERRLNHGETDDVVRQKAIAAGLCGLVPIVCVGENEEQRSSGRETDIVGWQLCGSLPGDFSGIVAYEPIWAIGSGRTASLEDIAAMHGFIRQELSRQLPQTGRKTRILYGGSVRPGNAAPLLALADVGGALVGGASLDAGEFLSIARSSGTTSLSPELCNPA